MKFTLLAVLAVGINAPLAGAQPAGAPTDLRSGPPPIKVLPPGTAAPLPPPPTSDPLRPIMRTHTLPPYPPESVAAQEQGRSLLEVHITTAGTVDHCAIVQTSGFDRLDQAACDHVTAVWLWQPPTFHGQPMAVSTRIMILWDLRQAQPQQ